jgi:hypothetical protein
MQAIPAVHAALAVQRRKRCTRQATVPGARALLPKGGRARVTVFGQATRVKKAGGTHGDVMCVK